VATHEFRAKQEAVLHHARLQTDRLEVQNTLQAKEYTALPAEGHGKGGQDRSAEAVRRASRKAGFRGFRGILMNDPNDNRGRWEETRVTVFSLPHCSGQHSSRALADTRQNYRDNQRDV